LGNIVGAQTFPLTDATRMLPLFTWRESIPFEVTSSSGEFPRPLLEGRTALSPYTETLSSAGSTPAKPEELRQWVQLPRLDVNTWSARPGEMTTTSWMTAKLQQAPGSSPLQIAMSGQSELTLRRARAVAGPDELVSLTTGDQTAVAILTDPV